MRPASYRSPNPFVRPKKKGGGKKLGLDMERLQASYNHKANDLDNQEVLRHLRVELVRAESEGKYSKAKKLRRQINQELEVSLYLRHSWCYGCNNVLHNCQCPTH